MNQPTDIFKPVYRCSNCGALLDPEAIKCDNCPATFRAVDVVDPVKVTPEEQPTMVTSYDYTQVDVINGLIKSVPNGCAVTNTVGGIGTMISDHYISMSVNAQMYDEDDLTLKSLVRAMTVMRMEGYTPDTIIINPVQMYDILTTEGDFIGVNERAFVEMPGSMGRSRIAGMIGIICGMNVIVSEHMSIGYVVMFDSDVFPDNRDAGVLLVGGRTRIS